MLRHTARLLVVTLILSSGRLLACGWDCLAELPIAAEASCHQQSTAPDAALNGGDAHPCPPEAVVTPVTISQKSSPASDTSADGATQTVAFASAIGGSAQSHRPPSRSPLSRARQTNVLRI